MTQHDDRPDLKLVRRKIAILVSVIATVLVLLVSLTFYLYARFTAGAHVTP